MTPVGVSPEPQSTTDSTTGRTSMSPCSFTVTRFPQLGSMPLTFDLSGGLDIRPLGTSCHASAPPSREPVQSRGNPHAGNSSAKLGDPLSPRRRRYYQQRLRVTSVAAADRGSASGGEGPDRNTLQPLERAGREPEATWKEARDDRSRRGSLEAGVMPTRCRGPGAGTDRDWAKRGSEADARGQGVSDGFHFHCLRVINSSNQPE